MSESKHVLCHRINNLLLRLFILLQRSWEIKVPFSFFYFSLGLPEMYMNERTSNFDIPSGCIISIFKERWWVFGVILSRGLSIGWQKDKVCCMLFSLWFTQDDRGSVKKARLELKKKKFCVTTKVRCKKQKHYLVQYQL